VILWWVFYLAVHFFIYVLVLRWFSWSRREGIILLYHAAPAALASACGLIWAVMQPAGATLAEVAIVISLQGIYSLSFLELWSLTQGGYSLHILSRICSAGGTVSTSALASLQQAGAGKRATRLAGLLRLRLIRAHRDRFKLSWQGRLVSACLASIARCAHLKRLG